MLTQKLKPIDSKVETKDHSIKKIILLNKKKFTPPTKEEADAYCKENKLNVDTFKFLKYYEASDWKIKGGTKMKNWKRACTLARSDTRKSGNWETPG